MAGSGATLGAKLPAGFNFNRGRTPLTGLEDPEELWDRLREAMAEAQAQAATSKKLAGRVQVLERQLSEAGALTDDELVAELPKRMARALESAQSVAREIVGRARRQQAAIGQEAKDSAAQIVRQAEDHAAQVLTQTAEKAAAHMASARQRAEDIVGAAEAQREQMLADMTSEAAVLQQRIAGLRRTQARLSEAYDVVDRTLAEARRALADGGMDLTADSPPSQNGAGRVQERPITRARQRQGAAALKVFDQAPTANRAG